MASSSSTDHACDSPSQEDTRGTQSDTSCHHSRAIPHVAPWQTGHSAAALAVLQESGNILCALQGARCCQPTAAVHETQLQCRWALTLQPACSGGCRHPSIMAQRDTHTPKCFPKAFKSSLWTLPRTPPRSRGSQPQLVGAFSTDAPSHPWNKCVLWAAPGSSCSPKAGRASGGTACPELPQKLGKNSHILSR